MSPADDQAAVATALPPFKALLFAMQWKHKAGQATHEDML